MKISKGMKTGELFFVKVDADEDLFKSIEEAVKQKGVDNAIVVTAVGSLRKAVFVNPRSLKKPPEVGRAEEEGPWEIVSLMGAIGKNHAHGGKAGHLHISLSHHGGPVVGGSLDYGSLAFYPIEVSLLAYEGPYDL
jgi:predicted DNA-binding protein with PD1-like motif